MAELLMEFLWLVLYHSNNVQLLRKIHLHVDKYFKCRLTPVFGCFTVLARHACMGVYVYAIWSLDKVIISR